jgi:DNA-binding HxlR family transcriptional regulator
MAFSELISAAFRARVFRHNGNRVPCRALAGCPGTLERKGLLMSEAHPDAPAVPAPEPPLPALLDDLAACPANDIFRRVGDKWSMLLLILLGGRPHRFNELYRAVEGVSQRTRTRTLRGRETDGLVLRELHPVTPPRVQDRLTPLGRTLLEPLSALASWAVRHEAEIVAARAV